MPGGEKAIKNTLPLSLILCIQLKAAQTTRGNDIKLGEFF